MGDGDHFQTVDPGEIVRIAGIDRQAIHQGRSRDHRIAGASGALTPAAAQRRGDLPKGSSCDRVERDRVEITLGLLQMRSLVVGMRHQRSNGKFAEGNSAG